MFCRQSHNSCFQPWLDEESGMRGEQDGFPLAIFSEHVNPKASVSRCRRVPRFAMLKHVSLLTSSA